MGFSPRRRTSPSPAPLTMLLLLATWALAHGRVAEAGGVFELRRQLRLQGQGGGGGDQHLADLLKHDARRHLISGVDVPLGGNPIGDKTGLYFTEIELGTPANRYHLEVDTGTDKLLINCVDCLSCPTKNSLGMDLKLYNPNASQSASTVMCADQFCLGANNSMPHGCIPTSPCPYFSEDEQSTDGYFVKDLLNYNKVSGDGQTTLVSTTITFGCGAKPAQDLGSPDQALDGILGFGPSNSNSSLLSQLADAGQVKKIFAHCLDSANGGGIFTIGKIVQPEVKTTTLVPDTPKYNVNLQSIDVDGNPMRLLPDTFSGKGKGTVFDSGTALVYLPEVVYKTITVALFDKHPETYFYNFQDFLCFHYSGSVDDVFPNITFHFEGDLPLNIYAHDYLLHNGSDWYCLGLRNGRSLQTMKDMVILGDLALSNKLVVYDLERQVIGWTDYDCSSSVKVEDELTSYDVKAHRISSDASIRSEFSIVALLFIFVVVLGW